MESQLLDQQGSPLCPFLNWVCHGWVVGIPYNLDVNPLSDIWFANTFHLGFSFSLGTMWEVDFCRGRASEERFNWGRNSRWEVGVASRMGQVDEPWVLSRSSRRSLSGAQIRQIRGLRDGADGVGVPTSLSALSFFPFIACPLVGRMNKSSHPGLHQPQLSWNFIIGKHCLCKLVPDSLPWHSSFSIIVVPFPLSREIIVSIHGNPLHHHSHSLHFLGP